MEFTTVKNLTWCNSEHTMFNADVTFTQLGEVPFACSQVEVGVYSHVTEIWTRALLGEFGAIAEYAAPVTPEAVPESEQPVTTGAQTL